MRKLILLLMALLPGLVAFAQTDDDAVYKYEKLEKRYRFRVSLIDKQNNSYSLKKPEAFLSRKALERRKRYGIKLDEYDLPVSPQYINELRSKGMSIHCVSKWNNTVVVETADTLKARALENLKFVYRVELVWVGPDSALIRHNVADRKKKVDNKTKTSEHHYGAAQKQVEMLNVQRLHAQGFKGEGMTIAILDGGFNNADAIKGLSKVRILGTRNFVNPSLDLYAEDAHGMEVLSCIAANTPGELVGTAPEVSVYLFQTEDGRSEQQVELDNYCAGLELADSLGCDVVTASLGYYKFDYPEMNLPYAALDGRTAVNSHSASLAASRGMLLLNSAGNEGDDTWKKIGFPADAVDILAVGAVKSDSINTTFSSLGFSADGRVKPDAMAMGQSCAVYDTKGRITHVNGTSFSCPILCGAVTCLWQAHREKTPLQIIDAIHAAGHYADAPNEVYGYGIPDIWKAHDILSKQ